MHDPTPPGRAWFYEDLPFPIANAMKNAVNGREVDNDGLVAVIETVLRFVASLQASSLLASGQAAPSRWKKIRGERLTLGDWLYLVRDLAKALKRSPGAVGIGSDLIDWPERVEGSLHQFKRLRNRSSHPGAIVEVERRQMVRGLRDATVSLLDTLSWLRRVELVWVIDYDALGEDVFSGKVKLFRGADPDPMYVERRWRGVLSRERFFVVSPVEGYALDVDPFLSRGIDGRPQVYLFNGVAGLGFVNVCLDALEPQVKSLPIEERRNNSQISWFAAPRRSTDMTRYELPEHPDTAQEVGLPVRVTTPAREVAAIPHMQSRDHSAARRQPRRGAWWPLLVALGVAGVAAAVVAGLMATRDVSSKTPQVTAAERPEAQPVVPAPASSGARTENAGSPARETAPQTAPPVVPPVRITAAPAATPMPQARRQEFGEPPRKSVQASASHDVIAKPVPTPRSTESAATALRLAPTAEPGTLGLHEGAGGSLSGSWRFDTEVFQAENKRRNAVGTRGHYELRLRVTTAPDRLEGRLVKTGYTEPEDTSPRTASLKGSVELARSPQTKTFVGRGRLFAADGSRIDIILRVARHGAALIGLWRYADEADARLGYSGALVGASGDAAELPKGQRCYLDCAAGCFRAGDDPLDDATERCLLGCAPSLDHCTGREARGPAPG